MLRRGIGTATGLALLVILTGCHTGSEGTESTAPPAPGPAAPGPGGTAPGRPGQPAGNSVLTAKVKNALITKGVDTSKITIDTTADGSVTLKGSVPKAEQKTLAEKLAKQVPGVK